MGISNHLLQPMAPPGKAAGACHGPHDSDWAGDRSQICAARTFCSGEWHNLRSTGRDVLGKLRSTSAWNITGRNSGRPTLPCTSQFHPFGPLDSEGLTRLFQYHVLEMLISGRRLSREFAHRLRSWHPSGFQVYCGPPIDRDDQPALERLSAYILRPQFRRNATPLRCGQRTDRVPDHQGADPTDGCSGLDQKPSLPARLNRCEPPPIPSSGTTSPSIAAEEPRLFSPCRYPSGLLVPPIPAQRPTHPLPTTPKPAPAPLPSCPPYPDPQPRRTGLTHPFRSDGLTPTKSKFLSHSSRITWSCCRRPRPESFTAAR